MKTYGVYVERADESCGYAKITYSEGPKITVNVTRVDCGGGNYWRIRGRKSLGDNTIYCEEKGPGTFTFNSENNKSYIFQIQNWNNDWVNTSLDGKEYSIFDVVFETENEPDEPDEPDVPDIPMVHTVQYYNKKEEGVLSQDVMTGESFLVLEPPSWMKEEEETNERTFQIVGEANGGYFNNNSSLTSFQLNSLEQQTTKYVFDYWIRTDTSGSYKYYPGQRYNMPDYMLHLHPFYNQEISQKFINNLTANLPHPQKEPSILKTYTVIFNANGGSINTNEQEVSDIRNWNFSGWATSNTATTADAEDWYTDNTTIYAYWTYIDKKATITLPTPTRPGYDFLGWATSISQTSNLLPGGLVSEVSSNMNYIAFWKNQGNGGVFIHDGEKWRSAGHFVYNNSSWLSN